MWLELLQGPAGRAPRHFTQTRRFPLEREAPGRWHCQVANWRFEGRVLGDRWVLDGPVRPLSVNGAAARLPVVLEALDVLLFDDGVAVRVHAQFPGQAELPPDWATLQGAEALVAGDLLLETGDAFGELLANPTPARRARWLALLLLPPHLGELEPLWDGAALAALEVRVSGGARVDELCAWLERLPRRLLGARIGAPLSALVLHAPHFTHQGGRPWREVFEALTLGLGGAPLPQLETLEGRSRLGRRNAREVLGPGALARLLAACPRLR